MPTHAEARDIVQRAAPALSDAERLAVRCIALHETNYGSGWKPPGVGSNNWGAITMPAPSRAFATPSSSTGEHSGGAGDPSLRGPLPAVVGAELDCEPNGFGYGDSRPDGAGGVVKYSTCFRRYPTPEAGAADVARVALKQNVRQAIAAGRGLRGVAEEMFRNRYYTGVSSSPETNIQRYADALERAKKTILASTGEPDPFPSLALMWPALLACAAAFLWFRHTQRRR